MSTASGGRQLLGIHRDVKKDDLLHPAWRTAPPLRARCRNKTLSLSAGLGTGIQLVLDGESLRFSDTSLRAVRDGFLKRRMRASEAERWLGILHGGEEDVRPEDPEVFATLHLIIAREHLEKEWWASAEEHLDIADAGHLRFREKNMARAWHARLTRALEAARTSARPLKLVKGRRIGQAADKDRHLWFVPSEQASVWWEGERVCAAPGKVLCLQEQGACPAPERVQCHEPRSARWSASEATKAPAFLGMEYAYQDARLCKTGSLFLPGADEDMECRLGFNRPELVGAGPERVLLLERGPSLAVLHERRLRRLDAAAASKLARTLPGSLLLKGGTFRLQQEFGVRLWPVGRPRKTWPLPMLLERPLEHIFSWTAVVASPDQRWVLALGLPLKEPDRGELWLFSVE